MLRGNKRDAERRLRHTHKLINREYLTLVFQAWAGRTAPTGCLVGWRVGAVRLAASWATWGYKGRFVKQLIESMDPSSSASDILRGLRPVIGTSNLRKRKGCSLPLIRNNRNETCATKKDAIDAWADYFTAMEGGERISASEQREKWIAGLESMVRPELDIEATVCPNLVELEQAFRRVKPGKAVGLDGIPPELCHSCPKAAAQLSYTQMLKLVCHGQEDLQHKGGTLAVAFKKGERDQCSSYRSLLISSHQGKTLHRALRQRTVWLVHGLPTGSTVRRTSTDASGLCQPHRQDFSTLSGRQGATTWPHLSGLGRGLLPGHQALGSWRCLVRWTGGSNGPQTTSGGRYLGRPLREPSEPRCVTLCPAASTSPSLHPGDPHGHVLPDAWTTWPFSNAGRFTTGRFLCRHRLRLSVGEDLAAFWTRTWQPGHFGWWPLCPLVSADDSQGLVTKGGIITGILLDLCKGHGMTPNLKKNKSEIMMAFRGKGVRQWKKVCFHDWQGQLPVCCADGVAKVHLVGAQKSPWRNLTIRWRPTQRSNPSNGHCAQCFQRAQENTILQPSIREPKEGRAFQNHCAPEGYVWYGDMDSEHAARSCPTT